MKTSQKAFKAYAFTLVGWFLCCLSAYADPVWHCSRNDVQVADASDDFTLASLSLEREVIRLSLRDLYTVYQGAPVKLTGNFALSACIIGGNSHLSDTAMTSIGAKSATTKALLTPNAVTPQRIHVVQNESDMLSCITKNHPAVGFLSKPTHTEAVGPCF
jgi:hypothetical protein